jgi:hypothetical protein
VSAAAPSPQISFNSFTGIYHLNRDSRGLSQLTTEETIVADFPSGGFYGITRALPTKFQGQSVNVKILSVTDTTNNPVPYKTKLDSSGDLVVTTGDPSIILSGPQTLKLSYQTRGVVNLGSKTDGFLLDVNGRGWSQQLSTVEAILYIPASFRADLKEAPSCYLSPNSGTNTSCEIDVQKTADNTIVTARASPVSAHQALVASLNFAPQTFTNNHINFSHYILLTAGLIVFLTIVIYFVKKVIL